MSEAVSLLKQHLELYLESPMLLPVTGVVAVAVFCWCVTRMPKPFKSSIDINNQSIDIGDGVHVSPLMKDLKDGQPMKYLFEDAQTLHEAFLRGLRLSRHEKCLGKRTKEGYEWITYEQVHDRAQAFGSGLIALGLEPRPDTVIGIYSINNTEWVLAEKACSMFSMVTVALYDTLGQKACQFIINLTNQSTIVCGDSAKAQFILDDADKITSLRTVIVIDTVSHTNLETAKKQNIQVLSFQDVEKMGKKNLRSPVPPKPSDVCTISFTSGTTGNPKGVMLTHGNVISSTSGFLYVTQFAHQFKNETYLSYLPLAHMFERTVQTAIFMTGGHVGFFSGDIKLLLGDLQMLKPTLFATVPRLLNRIRDKVYSGVSSSGIKKFLLDLAVSRKMALVKRAIVTRNTFWDKLVFHKVQSLLGGRVVVVLTGSAPVSEDTLNFIKCATGCFVIEGYGQTEVVTGITGQFPGDTGGGHVGGPLVCNYVKLVDVPDMNYFTSNNKGEVCVKGPNVFQGYYKDPEKTKETLDEDGWCHTGDIGEWLPNGALKIIDRKKHIFKLAQGEYVAPEKIEGIYVRSKYVAQVFVDGDSLKTCCMAVVVPDQEVMDIWAPKNRFPTDMDKLCANKQVKDIILKDLREHGKKAGLRGFEQVLDIALIPELFSVENGLLTPTLKSKRPELRKQFQPVIRDLYKQHDM
ncbi:long-chain-fatty-acid--CoA ligase 5-like [Gigantopelta aegis]|uniref:long-chain-fatty-acid--CoA ligase 5-like n=1 Tax=Gigantopelta aegis TaxID=1735272 RepID=UPI001B88D1AA|nr:long-chain-fatty-acid--CoA ligase 5-like [Gigantopelta aegis]